MGSLSLGSPNHSSTFGSVYIGLVSAPWDYIWVGVLINYM